MSNQLARSVANGFNRQPALLAPAYAEGLIDMLTSLASADDDEEQLQAEKRRDTLLATYGMASDSNERKPFAFSNGMAFISISGLLVNRFAYSWGWVTGYNAIREQLNAALNDPDVKGIVFDVNSGGGQVAGCFELAAELRAARDKKKCMAVVDASSYSAAYALSAAIGNIVVTSSGGVGSIGVVAMHVDYSKMLQESGIKVTFIYSGDHKVDGNPYQSLSPSVKADIQKSVDETRTEFVALVAEYRGLDTKTVFDTEARTYSAKEAVQLGLADAVKSPNEAVIAFMNVLNGTVINDKEKSMSATEVKPGSESTTATQEATQAENVQGETTETTTAQTAGNERVAERERIKGIQSHASAAGKSALANHLALNTDLSVDAAAAILAAAAPETKADPATGANAFAAAMDASDHPNVGADTGTQSTSLAQQILKAQEMATGRKQ